MNNENLPHQAKLISIRATAEKIKNLRGSLQSKVILIKKAIDPSEMKIPQGPMRIGGTWYV